MRQLFLSVWLILVFTCLPSQADITQTVTLQPIIDAITQSPEDTLVVMDVDDVLIKANDQILQLAHKPALDKIIANLAQTYSLNRIQELISIVMLQYQTSLIDPKIKDVFRLLHAKNIKFIALTAADTGKLGQIDNMEDWRIQTLNDLEFDFSGSFPEIQPIIFKDLPSTRNSMSFATYKKGILFSSDIPKGKVLKAFLTEIKGQFKHIIFVDDLRKNLDSVESFCQDASLTYQGFEYTANALSLPLNEKRVKFQIDTLINKNKWLSDIEADKELTTS
jgi:hypothetical protein